MYAEGHSSSHRIVGGVVMMLAQERCDARSCGVQAYVRVALRDAGTLDFCYHHFMLYEHALVLRGAVIVADDRRMLTREFALS